MSAPLITLTSDFGLADPYVAAMKGVILSINPAAQIIDLSHALPAQDVLHGAFFLLGAIPHFPPEALHVVVVDPGVGTGRRLLHVDLGPHRLLLPDNGLMTLLAQKHPPHRLIELKEQQCWAKTVSPSFHGRDILAPVAARLSLGLDPAVLGPIVRDFHSLSLPRPRRELQTFHGEVVHVDHFGNLITNVSADDIRSLEKPVVQIGGRVLPFVRAYGDAAAGQAVALVSSSEFVEIAVVQGRACTQLGAGRGTPVTISTERPGDSSLARSWRLS